MNTDKLMLKPCIYHRRVSQPVNEWIEPSDTIIVCKTLNNETDDYIRQSSNKVNLWYLRFGAASYCAPRTGVQRIQFTIKMFHWLETTSGDYRYRKSFNHTVFDCVFCERNMLLARFWQRVSWANWILTKIYLQYDKLPRTVLCNAQG